MNSVIDYVKTVFPICRLRLIYYFSNHTNIYNMLIFSFSFCIWSQAYEDLLRFKSIYLH